ncbi:hypothetical protein VTO42DRAFT_7598 [Malbranchea cinnamomea]
MPTTPRFLLIGVDFYQPAGPSGSDFKGRNLSGCVRDVTDLDNYLQSTLQIPADQITKLTSSTPPDNALEPIEPPENHLAIRFLSITQDMGDGHLRRSQKSKEPELMTKLWLRQRAEQKGNVELQMRATNNLAQFPMMRFEQLGALEDVTEGIQLAEEAVATADDKFTAAQGLNNLSIL